MCYHQAGRDSRSGGGLHGQFYHTRRESVNAPPCARTVPIREPAPAGRGRSVSKAPTQQVTFSEVLVLEMHHPSKTPHALITWHVAAETPAGWYLRLGGELRHFRREAGGKVSDGTSQEWRLAESEAAR